MTRRLQVTIAASALMLGAAMPARAQDGSKPATAAEAQASLARRGAGFTIGSWSMIDAPSGSGVSSSESPLGEAYFRKGIDQHLALETTAGIWLREITTAGSGGIGGSSGGTTSVILLPQFTGLKLYPATTPDDAFEPFVSAGGGFTLGFQSNSGGGALLGGGGGASGLIVGGGGGAGAGFDWRFSSAFGRAVGGHYTYVRFFDDIAGERMYRGTGLKAGLAYRFRY